MSLEGGKYFSKTFDVSVINKRPAAVNAKEECFEDVLRHCAQV
jgi:hypothetical protein